ncbi:helix-turn-helix domain-containing protein [Fructilactobacillus hinvesii]|uniref:Helix-turn-helix domain-containing protein n=1 Tax=Fructilactobacillus hinvesii TaxID=2940300 RepID=A0ABY5BQV7_9LACO|nr:helix-turn-helix domain-containing protein [Fructilactobacillus hinvesii]USS87490.1 helix-turn-helix domain-containing protein [Fructilactobacillus hinvesii]
MTRIKKYKQGYSMISNQLVQDDRLSWKARGLFGYLWSQPDDWQFYETEVAKHAADGRASLRSGLNELEKYGYLRRERQRNDGGHFKGTYWELSDVPMFDNRTQVTPMSDYRMLENRTLQTKDSTKLVSGLVSDDEKSESKQETKNPGTQEPSSPAEPKTPDGVDEALNNYEAMFECKPNLPMKQAITTWVVNFGLELVLYTLESAAKRQVSTGGLYYWLDKAFQNYQRKGIKTVDAAMTDTAKYNEKHHPSHLAQTNRKQPVKRQRRNNYVPNIRETLPNWATQPDNQRSTKKSDPNNRALIKQKLANLRQKDEVKQ